MIFHVNLLLLSELSLCSSEALAGMNSFNHVVISDFIDLAVSLQKDPPVHCTFLDYF